MDSYSETEHRRLHIPDLRPRLGAIGRFEDSVVMLHPQRVGAGGALHEAVHILTVRIELLFGRTILRTHALACQVPGFSSVFRDPYTAGRDANTDVTRIARIDAD